MEDLQSIGLEVMDFSKAPELADAIRRYQVLLQMTFDGTGIYKLFETPISQIQRFFGQVQLGMPAIVPQHVQLSSNEAFDAHHVEQARRCQLNKFLQHRDTVAPDS